MSAVTVMAVLLILLVPAACCCYARRRKIRHFQGHRRLKNMYLAVSEQTAKLSPEDRHIVAMQVREATRHTRPLLVAALLDSIQTYIVIKLITLTKVYNHLPCEKPW